MWIPCYPLVAETNPNRSKEKAKMVTTAEAETGTKTGRKTRTRKSTSTPAKPANKRGGSKKPMTPEHKAKLAEGREHARIVGNYLDALEVTKPKRGRKVTLESQQAKLARAEEAVKDATGVEKLRLTQEIMDLQGDIEVRQSADPTTDITALQAAFVKIAKSYGESKGYSKKAFAALGVPAEVLKEAGFGRANAKAA